MRSFLVTERVSLTATSRLCNRNFSPIPVSDAAFDTKLTEVSLRAPPNAPNMGR